MHKVIKAVLILAVVSLLVAFVRESQLNQQKLELKQIEVKDTSLELKKLNEKYNQELEKSNVNQQTIEQLQKEKDELNKQLQAKKEQQAKLAQKRVGSGNVAYAAPAGNWVDQCHAWAAQAGISLDNAAITLIGKESKCSPSAQNPTSTAYGIGQFLNSTWAGAGCVKTPDPVQQLKCMHTYVTNRYNSWQGALNFHRNNNWY